MSGIYQKEGSVKEEYSLAVIGFVYLTLDSEVHGIGIVHLLFTVVCPLPSKVGFSKCVNRDITVYSLELSSCGISERCLTTSVASVLTHVGVTA